MMSIVLEMLESPITIITVLVIGTICETLRRLVRAKAGDKGIRGVFSVLSTGPSPDSQGILPVLLSIPLGFIPWLPTIEALEKDGFETAGRFGTYLFAGVVCKLGYDTIMGTVMQMVRNRSATRAAASLAPEAPAPPAAPSAPEAEEPGPPKER